MMKEALYYSPGQKNNAVNCRLCPRGCVIADGTAGVCGIRRSEGGKLYALVYGKYTAASMDPIEKKPLYHFHPGKNILSIGTVGCNLKCMYCQNHEISQSLPEDFPLKEMSTGDIINLAEKKGSIGIAYTYNEPLINYEHLLEIAAEAKNRGLVNVLVTNGFINEEPLARLLPYIDAANVDVKAFKNSFYKEHCGGSVGPVMRTVEILFRKGKHVEVTNLIIPGLNDSREDIMELTDWVSALSCELPVHFSRYHPAFRMTMKQTELATLERVVQTASGKLKHVYMGNVWEKPESNTYCPGCGHILIQRYGYSTEVPGVSEGLCSNCGADVNIVF